MNVFVNMQKLLFENCMFVALMILNGNLIVTIEK